MVGYHMIFICIATLNSCSLIFMWSKHSYLDGLHINLLSHGIQPGLLVLTNTAHMWKLEIFQIHTIKIIFPELSYNDKEALVEYSLGQINQSLVVWLP